MENQSSDVFNNEQIKSIEKAISIMNPYCHKNNKPIMKLSSKEILRNLLLFDYPTIDLIIQYGNPEVIQAFIVDTANTILKAASSLQTNELYKLNWFENKRKMQEEIKSRHHDLFKKVDYLLEQEHNRDCAIQKIHSLHRRAESSISALISTDQEAQQLKDKIIKAYSKLESEITVSLLESAHRNEVLYKLNETKSKDLEFIDIKHKEEPVRLYYTLSKSKKPIVKMKWNKHQWVYTIGRGKEIRPNRGNDFEQYPLIVSVGYIMDFLCQNDIRDEDIWVDPDSIDKFYSFNDTVSEKLTPTFVKNWWNLSCPDLYRHVPNKDHSTNMLGMPICHFSNKLVETNYSADFIDENITEEEVNILAGYNEGSRIAKTMRSQLKARKIKEDKEKVAELKLKVERFDKRVQAVIDKHKDEIIQYLMDRFPNRVKKSDNSVRFDDDFGLDCGFIHIVTTDKEYTDNRLLLRQIDYHETPWMNIRLPYESQSTTFQKEEFNKIKEIVFGELNIMLSASTVLD